MSTRDRLAALTSPAAHLLRLALFSRYPRVRLAAATAILNRTGGRRG